MFSLHLMTSSAHQITKGSYMYYEFATHIEFMKFIALICSKIGNFHSYTKNWYIQRSNFSNTFANFYPERSFVIMKRKSFSSKKYFSFHINSDFRRVQNGDFTVQEILVQTRLLAFLKFVSATCCPSHSLVVQKSHATQGAR